MVTVQVEAKGAQAVEQWLASAPGRLREQIWTTTERDIQEVLKPAVVERTPRRTGTLAGSIAGTVSRTGNGARGVLISKVRYVSFVERGTKEHGPARQMFQRGYEATLREVAASYEKLAVTFVESAT